MTAVVVEELVVQARSVGGDGFRIGPISFDVDAGQRLLLAGRSGVGRTHLLMSLAGVRPRAVVAGRASLKGPIGVVFARDALDTDRSVIDNVMDGVDDTVAVADARGLALQMLEALAIGDVSERSPTHLSGGQRRRVALARALVGAPGTLLLDEPTAGLDPATGLDVLEVIARIAPDAAVIISSQDIDVTATWAHRALLLERADDGDVCARTFAIGNLPAPFAPIPFVPFLSAAGAL